MEVRRHLLGGGDDETLWRDHTLLTATTDISKNQACKSSFIKDLVLTKLIGYGEAAVKLQRDWKLDPQSLPLAKHIKGGALIRLIKYGLRYYYTDKTWDRVSLIC